MILIPAYLRVAVPDGSTAAVAVSETFPFTVPDGVVMETVGPASAYAAVLANPATRSVATKVDMARLIILISSHWAVSENCYCASYSDVSSSCGALIHNRASIVESLID